MQVTPAVWSVAQHVGRMMLATLFYFAIAGFLTPADVGVLGIATVWIVFLGVFLELGFGAAIIQRQQIERRHLTTVFFVNVAVGVLLSLLGALASWPTSSFMRVPEAQPVMFALSMGFVISALGTVPGALATRQLRFRALAVRDWGGILAGGAVGVILAWDGWGVWSFVAQSLITNLVGTTLLWNVSSYRPRFTEWSPSALRELWPYSGPLFGVSLFKYLVQNADSLIIGYFFGPFRLGLYALANKVLIQPIAAVESGVGTFLFTRVARLQDEPARVAALYVASYKSLNYLLLPLVIVAGVWGGTLVSALLGTEWQEVGPIFWYLAVMGLMHPPITPVGQLMKGLGKTHWFLRWSILFSVATNGALLVGSQFGFAQALAGLAIAYVVMLPLALVILNRLIQGVLPQVLRAAVRSYFVGLSFAVVLLSSRAWIGNHVSVALASTAVGALLYMKLVQHSDPEFTTLLRRQLIGLPTP